MQIVHVAHAFDRFHPERIFSIDRPRGVPSSRMLSVSRTMSIELHRISAAMMSESTGSIQFWRSTGCPRRRR